MALPEMFEARPRQRNSARLATSPASTILRSEQGAGIASKLAGVAPAQTAIIKTMTGLLRPSGRFAFARGGAVDERVLESDPDVARGAGRVRLMKILLGGAGRPRNLRNRTSMAGSPASGMLTSAPALAKTSVRSRSIRLAPAVTSAHRPAHEARARLPPSDMDASPPRRLARA